VSKWRKPALRAALKFSIASSFEALIETSVP